MKTKEKSPPRTVALAGNPNVGKSTVFNALTGMRQHTGNWPGKTVESAVGFATHGGRDYRCVDIPGTYSLFAHSPEEEVAREYLAGGEADCVVLVCDATCLARNLALVLQVLELTPRAVLCVNLLDEARARGIAPDLPALSAALGIPVVGTVARRKKTLAALFGAIEEVCAGEARAARHPDYPVPIAEAIVALAAGEGAGGRFAAIRRLCGEGELPKDVEARLVAQGYTKEGLQDAIAAATVETAAAICQETTKNGEAGYSARDRRLDRILTGRRSAYPVMLLLLALIFFITVIGANYPSALLSAWGEWLCGLAARGLAYLAAPPWLIGLLVDGILCVLFRVVAVMLPPMAIFFPLFTLLEDSGYLPRIAYNLDRPFAACRACGKQALTMCMGFGCNAAGVVGCRIVDSPRERLLAILTNSLVPCNGRFPALLSLIAMFFIGAAGGFQASLLSALLLLGFVLLGVGMTFAITALLSRTLLRGQPSSFVLEMPPYRRPQVGRVLVRSLFDRTAFVLRRAAAVAAPAGAVIWLFANLTVGGETLLSHAAAFLDPFASLLGLDGVILLAFILGLPANEIVLPLVVMGYLSLGSPAELSGIGEMRALFLENGWTVETALCTAIFFLFHWPCSTTLITVHKETGKWRYTLLAALLPTAVGMLLCAAVAFIL
ncbi:MAG: ferrous iron transport protein B [Clostridia bacterium]|nr:ferrous iron transport protein B [Clostridia bacterium]